MKGNARVAVLGPEGTFTESAAREIYPSAEIVYCSNEAEVFDSVSDGKTEYGVVAIENSLEGSVAKTMACLLSYDVYIVAEIVLDINLCLISNSDSDEIDKIMSHPHALDQSANFIKENYPKAVRVSSASTAAAVRDIADEVRASAIGPKYAAVRYGLKVIRENVQDEPSQTRFIAISKKKSKGDKTSIIFAVKDRPGALYGILKIFADKNINLTKIESRPSRRKLGEYLFFMDFENRGMSWNEVDGILKEVEHHTTLLKDLGSY
ncbi:MAG: prephenate dehydratase [Candidatus Altiarchaeota archaeon]